jgi:predicted peptidase
MLISANFIRPRFSPVESGFSQLQTRDNLMKTIRLLLLLLFAASSSNLFADDGQKAAKLDTQVKVQMNYLLYLPKDYEKQESWPLLLFLHGSGERGDDLEHVKVHGPPKLISKGKEFPFIVVSPQCPKERRWEPIELVALLDDLSSKYKVDQDRICVTGLSMGGFGSWQLASFATNRLAAIASDLWRRRSLLDSQFCSPACVGFSRR